MVQGSMPGAEPRRMADGAIQVIARGLYGFAIRQAPREIRRNG